MRYYSNASIATSLNASLSSTATTMAVADITGLPVTYPYTLILDIGTASEELVEVTGSAGSVLQVLRGVDNSVALAHSPNATVTHGVSARDYQESRNHEAASLGVHGLGAASSVVGTTDTQTLTNKTLTSPTINGATWGPTTTFPGSEVTGTVPNSSGVGGLRIQTGWVDLTVSLDQGGATDAPVTWPTPFSSSTGVVAMFQANSGAGSTTGAHCTANSFTATGCKVSIWGEANTTVRRVYYIAVGPA